ncbi:MAG: LysR family transcriptional regulator, partial [Acutalibacteraceae bacterium]
FLTFEDNNMDINHIKYFISVAHTLNFTESAKQNFVSQSTVSRGISELEKEIGARLFIRSKKHVVLSPEGKAFLPHATEIIENLKGAMFTIEKLQKGVDGRLTIGYDETSSTLIAKYLKDFVKKYPHITLDIKKIETDQEILETGDNEYDILFTLRDMLPDRNDIEYKEIFYDELCIICQKGNFAKSTLKLSDLQNERFILLSERENPVLYMEILDIFRTYNMELNIQNSFDSIKSIVTAVSSGIGISIIPRKIADTMKNNLFEIHKIKDIDTIITYALAWNKGMKNSSVSLFLREIMKKTIDYEDNYII